MKRLINDNKGWLLAAAWLYTLTFAFDNYWSRSSSYPAIAQDFSKQIRNRLSRFDRLCADTATIRKLQSFELDGNAAGLVQQKDAFYYLYADGPNGMVLQFWSNASIVPPADGIPYRDTIRYVAYRNGRYVMASRKIPNSLLTAVQLILIKQEYDIQHSILQPEYTLQPGLAGHIEVGTEPTEYAVSTADGRPVFYLHGTQSGPLKVFNWASLLVQLTVFVLLLIFINRVGIGLAHQRRLPLSFGWMFSMAILIRVCLSGLHFPVDLSHVILFEKLTGYHWFYDAVGSLLVHLLLLVWLVHFIFRTRYVWLPALEKKADRSRKLFATAAISGLLVISFLLSRLATSLVLQPDISFDVADFFSLSINTAGAIACLYFICVLHYRLMHLSNELFNRLWPGGQRIKYLLVAVVSLLVLTLLVPASLARLQVLILCWLLASLLVEDVLPRLFQNSLEPSGKFVFWLIWYAIAGSLLVASNQQLKEFHRKQQLARNQAWHANTEDESIIYETINDKVLWGIKNQPLLAGDSSYNRYYRQQITEAFNKALGNYHTTVYLFDSARNALFNPDSTHFQTLNTIPETQGTRQTRFRHIYLQEKASNQYSYLVRLPLYQDSVFAGTLFVSSTPILFYQQTLAPQLFGSVDGHTDPMVAYDYAVYQKGILSSYQTRRFAFPTRLSASDLQLRADYETRPILDREALWYNAGNHRIIIIVKEQGPLSEIITFFAYLFGCFILLYLLELFLSRVLTGNYHLHRRWSFGQVSIRNKIRRTVILISLVSFVFIGVSTLFFFKHRFQAAKDNRLIELAKQADKDLNLLVNLPALLTGSSSAATVRSDSSIIRRVADLLNTDINLFDLEGNLSASSQYFMYTNHIVSPKMNALAYYHMARLHQVQFLQQETIGNLSYQSIYLPVRPSDSTVVGYINIPYFTSQADLNQEISTFLVTLINLIAFIFLIAGLVAFFITNSITASFFIIGQKMKAVGLGKTNEPIEWNRNDEIGVLVQQYNKMLEQLDESARKLATSEREYAWREMAKQVAHEIKNPLTPMKLNLQYLQYQLEKNAPDVHLSAARMTATLVAQIDHLSQIASDFSQFARINVARNETFDLHDVLQQVVALYEMDEHLQLSWEALDEPVLIEADKTQISRLFTNLIKNASEAVPDETAIVTIRETRTATTLTIRITDNGPGIPEEMKQQLFRPNFTTKSSGTGLGLAICKDIVERSGGTIWFESGNGQPTTFFIQLPLAAG